MNSNHIEATFYIRSEDQTFAYRILSQSPIKGDVCVFNNQRFNVHKVEWCLDDNVAHSDATRVNIELEMQPAELDIPIAEHVPGLHPCITLIDILDDCLHNMVSRKVDANDIVDILGQVRHIRAAITHTIQLPVVISQLKWSNEREPSDTIRYNHVVADSALGTISIEWKGWKANDGYATYIDGDYFATSNTLDEAKAVAADHLNVICQRLIQGSN